MATMGTTCHHHDVRRPIARTRRCGRAIAVVPWSCCLVASLLSLTCFCAGSSATSTTGVVDHVSANEVRNLRKDLLPSMADATDAVANWKPIRNLQDEGAAVAEEGEEDHDHEEGEDHDHEADGDHDDELTIAALDDTVDATPVDPAEDLLHDEDHDEEHEEGEDHDHDEVGDMETAGGAEEQLESSTTAVAIADDGEEHDHEHENEEEGEEHEDVEEEHDHDHEGEEEGDEHEDHEDHDHDHEGDEHDHDDEDAASEFDTLQSSANANEDQGKPWGQVILATFLVNLATLIGLVVLIPTVLRSKICCGRLKRQAARRYTQAFSKSATSKAAAEAAAAAATLGTAAATRAEKKRGPHGRLIDIAIPSFAAGALLAATVFLILPESIYLLGLGTASMLGGTGEEDDHDGHDHGAEEGTAEAEDDHDHDHFRRLQDDHDGHDHGPEGLEWKFGCAVLGGFLLPMVLGALFPRASEHDCDAECGERPDLRDSTNNFALDRTSCNDHDQCCAHKADGAAAGGSDDDELSAKVIDEEDPVDDAVTASKSAISNCSSCCEKGEDCEDPDDCIALDHDHSHHNHEATDGPVAEERAPPQSVTSKNGTTSTHHIRRNINYRLCASILLGDGVHNFADGIFIGVGFLLCSRDVAITIFVITLYHELAQELADFFILTKHAGLSVPWALCLNFSSGFFVMLGGITVLAVDTLTAQAVGIILAVAGGVYIQIGASECIPRVDAVMNGWKDRVIAILLFATGAVPIGLALLNHHHCEG